MFSVDTPGMRVQVFWAGKDLRESEGECTVATACLACVHPM